MVGGEEPRDVEEEGRMRRDKMIRVERREIKRAQKMQRKREKQGSSAEKVPGRSEASEADDDIWREED